MRSFIESFIDVGSGFILAVFIQLYIFPFFGLHPTIMDSIGIALIFTGVSITRSWLWRMAFKKYNTTSYLILDKRTNKYIKVE